MKFFKYRYIVVCAMFVLSGCSLFEPRDTFEDPQPQGPDKVADPFMFEQILACPKDVLNPDIRFTKTDLNDLFSDNLVYLDVNVSRGYSKSAVTKRLDQIEKPTSVTWTDGSCTRRSDSIFIRDIEYTMTFSSEGDIKGQSDFDIVNDGFWQIVRWVNYPSGAITASKLTPLQE